MDSSTFISAEQIATLQSLGLPVYEGDDPPDITGTYLCNDLVLYDSNIPEDSPYIGDSYADMEIKFYRQYSSGRVRVSYDQSGYETGTGMRSFISGSGNNFTVFTEISGTSDSGIDFEDAMLFSGTISAGGISNFSYGLLMTYKSSDPDGYLINVGDARVFVEDDGLAAFGSLPSIHPTVQRPAGSAR